MSVSQKCQYSLRAVFELAKHYGEGPLKIADIAERQAIPTRFLEVILNQLKQAGFVESRRGSMGGYTMARLPSRLTTGEVIRYIEGPLSPVQCMSATNEDQCPFQGDCAFMPMWERARAALSQVYDTTTFEDLLEEEKSRHRQYVPNYSI